MMMVLLSVVNLFIMSEIGVMGVSAECAISSPTQHHAPPGKRLWFTVQYTCIRREMTSIENTSIPSQWDKESFCYNSMNGRCCSVSHDAGRGMSVADGTQREPSADDPLGRCIASYTTTIK